MILHIETATDVCSVVLANDRKVIAHRESAADRSHASVLAVFIDEVMKEAGVSFKDLLAVAVSKGPGSYTGLRIGVSTAKGICYAMNIPLIAVNTLQAMSASYLFQFPDTPSSTLLLPMIDARRMEVYGAVLDSSLNFLEDVKAEVLTENSFMSHQAEIVMFGDGAHKAVDVFTDKKNVSYNPNYKQSALGLIAPALKAFAAKQFENTAYFEPFYLKEFVTGAR